MLNNNIYEQHLHNDPAFPIIFHLNILVNHNNHVFTHWHESIEILYIVEGVTNVLVDTDPVIANPGDIVVVNSYSLHNIEPVFEGCKYYCLILDSEFCSQFSLPIEDTIFKNLITDKELSFYYENIINCMENKDKYYQTNVKAWSLLLLTRLFDFPNKQTNNIENDSSRINIVKKATEYIRHNFFEDINLDVLSKYIGVSKYYFCRVFKEITGKTVVSYINSIRCDNARRLIKSGDYNVSESAQLSGFKNLSHFSRTYKNIFGVLPSHHSA